MNKHNKKLADFVIEQYNKVKKAKKSPKNFDVWLIIDNGRIDKGEYTLCKIDQGYLSNVAIRQGLLFDLYIDANELKVKLCENNSEVVETQEIPQDAHNTTNMYQVWLNDCKGHKLECVKLVKEATGLGLREAKELCDAAPIIVLQTSDSNLADQLQMDLNGCGADAHMLLPANHKKPDAYTGFDIHWIPIFKQLLSVEFQEIVYNDLDKNEKKIVSEEEFINIINWIKL